MKREPAGIFSAGFVLLFTLVGCGTNATPTPTTVPTVAPTAAFTATPFPSGTPTALHSALPTQAPTVTPTPTQTLAPSPTATVSPLLAARAKIDSGNAGNIQRQAQWGLGAIHSQTSLQDGKLVLVQTAEGMYLYDSQTLTRIEFFPKGGSPYFSDDGNLMLFSDSSQVTIYDLANTRPYKSLKGSLAFTTVSFSHDNKFLAVVHSSTDIDIVRLDDMSSVNLTRDRTAAYEPETHQAAFSPDNQFLLTSENGGLVMWNIKEQKLVWYMKNFNQSILRKPFSPDGRFFLTQDNRGSTLRDARFGTELFSALGSGYGSPFSKDGKLFYLVNKKVVTIYTLAEYPGVVRSLMADGAAGSYFSDDSTQLIAGNKALNLADFKVETIEITAKKPAEISPAQALQLGHFNNLKGFATGKQGELWVWGILDRQVFLWETVSGKVQYTEITGKKFLANIAFDAASLRFAACTDKGLEVFSMQDGTHKLFSACQPNGQVAFSADGNWIARAALTRIELLNSHDGSTLHQMPEHTVEIDKLVFSPDGKWLAVGTVKNMLNGYCEVSLWKLDPFGLVGGFRGKLIPGGVNDLAVTPDGQWLVGLTNMLRLWRTADSEQMKYVEAYGTGLALSPDGSLAAVANAGSITWWSVPGFEPAGSQSASSGDILGLGFTPDGSGLITFDEDGLVRLWAAQ